MIAKCRAKLERLREFPTKARENLDDLRCTQGG
jgi:hypothetical protein